MKTSQGLGKGFIIIIVYMRDSNQVEVEGTSWWEDEVEEMGNN